MKKKPVILVVDDQAQNVELIEAYLVEQDYEIISAANGEEALARLSNDNIDLVLLDVLMPGMDGFEVTRRIRQDTSHTQLPIIMVTALRDTEDRVNGIEAGCDDFISKPVEKTELLARVRSLLKIKTYNDMLNSYRKELEISKLSADEAREYAESIINTIREPLIVLDKNLCVVKASRSFYEVFKVNPGETMGQRIYDLGNKQWDIPKLRELLETILPKKTPFDNYEVEHDFTTIGKRTMLLNARQIQGVSGGELIILLAIEDITERKRSDELIRRMASHDSLTGLPNRKLFSERLISALIHAKRYQKKIGIMMLDLDKFKEVNDSLGHDAGDILLKETTVRLGAALRDDDTVARFGGDEFVLLLPHINEIEDAALVAQKIVDLFSKPFFIDSHQLSVTTSIGIAVYPDDGINESILLKNADIAMYQAKQAGRSRYQLYKNT